MLRILCQNKVGEAGFYWEKRVVSHALVNTKKAAFSHGEKAAERTYGVTD